MITPTVEMTLEQCHKELEEHLAKTSLTKWAVNRIQQLTYRIHELDPHEIETSSYKPNLS